MAIVSFLAVAKVASLSRLNRSPVASLPSAHLSADCSTAMKASSAPLRPRRAMSSWLGPRRPSPARSPPGSRPTRPSWRRRRGGRRVVADQRLVFVETGVDRFLAVREIASTSLVSAAPSAARWRNWSSRYPSKDSREIVDVRDARDDVVVERVGAGLDRAHLAERDNAQHHQNGDQGAEGSQEFCSNREAHGFLQTRGRGISNIGLIVRRFSALVRLKSPSGSACAPGPGTRASAW